MVYILVTLLKKITSSYPKDEISPRISFNESYATFITTLNISKGASLLINSLMFNKASFVLLINPICLLEVNNALFL